LSCFCEIIADIQAITQLKFGH